MPLSGLPVLPLLSSCLRASANTSAETDQCACRSLPDLSSAFPIISNGLASALPVSRFAQHSLTFRPASSPSRPMTTIFIQSASNHVVTSMIRPGCYNPERQLLGRFRTCQRKAPFHGARHMRARHDNQPLQPITSSGGEPNFSMRSAVQLLHQSCYTGQ